MVSEFKCCKYFTDEVDRSLNLEYMPFYYLYYDSRADHIVGGS